MKIQNPAVNRAGWKLFLAVVVANHEGTEEVASGRFEQSNHFVAKLGRRGMKLEDIPWKLRDHAWFAAYAPASNPEIVVVVLNEHGGGGSSAAAPIAMEVIKAWHAKKEGRALAAPGGNSRSVAVLVDEETEAPIEPSVVQNTVEPEGPWIDDSSRRSTDR